VLLIPADVPLLCPAADFGLRFRGSGLRSDQVVVSARLQLAPGDPAVAKAALSEVVGWRRANQPGGQNAGSVFVNPVPGEVSAGRLVDEVGLRGLRRGSASVSDKHANFIQADDGGSADDVRELMRIVAARVEAETGYALRSEIRLIGFDS
jgi:UDP-N-acetylmuramate dehydrogenase